LLLPLLDCRWVVVVVVVAVAVVVVVVVVVVVIVVVVVVIIGHHPPVIRWDGTPADDAAPDTDVLHALPRDVGSIFCR
jgi:hypothetical protein